MINFENMRERDRQRLRDRDRDGREREIDSREREGGVYGTPEVGECIIIKTPSASTQLTLVPVRVPGRERWLFLL